MNPQIISGEKLGGEIREEIVNLLQGQDLTEEQKDELILRATKALFERVSLVLVSHLSDEQFKEFSEKYPEGSNIDPLKVNEDLKRMLPNMDEIVKDAIKTGLEEYLNALKKD